jgi:hypothetical protein
VTANHRRGAEGVSQSQEGRQRNVQRGEDDHAVHPVACTPITGGEQKVTANHRRGAGGVSQSQEGSRR